MTENDPVNHPKHYTVHPSGIECIEITRHMNFNIGNAMKYIWRAGIKDESTNIQDLKKAIWYINDEIARLDSSKPQLLTNDNFLERRFMSSLDASFIRNRDSNGI